MYTFNASVTGVTLKHLVEDNTMANVPVPAPGAAPRPDEPIHPKGLYKAFAASLTGTALEWYDFAVYSAAAAVVFPIVFFPSSDPMTGHHPGLLHLRRGLHFPARGRHHLRPARRSRSAARRSLSPP